MSLSGESVASREYGNRDLKFQALAADLKRAILAGTWAVGAKLPTEQQLTNETGLSLTTVRRAFDELVQQDLVVRRQGAGTFVAARRPVVVRSSATIGVMIPTTQLYYPRVLQGIEDTLSLARTGLQLSTYNYDPSREESSIQFLLDAGVDGLLLVPTFTDLADPLARARELMSLPVPVVMIERNLMQLGPADITEYVCSDHQGGAYDAVTHLHSLGHREIALLVRSNNPTASGVVQGFLQAIDNLSLTRHEVLSARKTEWEADQGSSMFDALRSTGCTAALVFGDREAAMIESAAFAHGVKVPDDLALVSYDDETADIAQVPLTAVSSPKHRIGQMAAELLLRRLAEGQECPLHQVRLRPRLVIRDSCGAKRPPRTPQ